MGSAENDELLPWSDIADDEWSTLLIGNGLSINIWKKLLSVWQVDARLSKSHFDKPSG